jgi:hypothetical protein
VYLCVGQFGCDFGCGTEWWLWLGERRFSSATHTCYPVSTQCVDLWRKQRLAEPETSDVLADWLQDHRDDLLTGATGPDPAGRLDLLIHWLREVRCFGRENVPA